MLAFPLILLGAMAVTSVMVVADSLPKLNTAPGCKAAAAFSRAMDSHVAQGFESCMDDEETAHTRLLEGWETYPADAKKHCLDQSMHNEDQSYVDVLECLHLALGIEPPKPPLHGAKKRQKSQ
jgi:hypothetical protein